MTLQAALTQQREDVVDEFGGILLMLDSDETIVRLELFILSLINCSKLLTLLSSTRSPYHNIVALLLCRTSTRHVLLML